MRVCFRFFFLRFLVLTLVFPFPLPPSPPSVRLVLCSLVGYESLEVKPSEEGEGATADDSADQARRLAHFKSWRDYLGKDITSLVILPVWIMQPFSMLQNMCEIMEYTEALDRAAKTEDAYERLAWVAGFTMGPFGAVERTWKPFNPILGETFELVDADKGFRFLAEQVSHHPPVGASHSESELWTYGLVSAPKTKFLGNSVEVFPVGRTRITLKTTGETFSLVPPPSKVNNVIVGRVWIDTCGTYRLTNTTTGALCEITFTECGWFGAGRYEMLGYVMDAEGNKKLRMEGKWNEYLEYVPCDEEGEPIEGAEFTRVWTCKPKPENDPYGFTAFAKRLCAPDGTKVLGSDSRRRPDRSLLEDGESHRAAIAKHNLEEMQRAEAKRRTEEGETWKPRWFAPAPEDDPVLANEVAKDECPMWRFTGDLDTLAKEKAEDEEVHGHGFQPWEWPDMHPELGKEDERQ